MNGDLISKKTRQVFREHLVGWTLREISEAFDAADVACDLSYQPLMAGQRRSRVEQYYHAVTWDDWREIKKVVKVYEDILERAHGMEKFYTLGGRVTAQAQHERLAIDRMINALKRDGFQWIDGRIVTGVGMPSLENIKETAAEFDAHYLSEQIRRLEQSVDVDPPLAIGTAKELVETCCRTILAERGKPVTGTPDLPTLTKQTMKELALVPESIPEQAKGAETIKRLLSNLATICQGLAEIRGLYGTGHGKDGRTQTIKPRHAKLAVGAAVTLASFLFDTHKARE